MGKASQPNKVLQVWTVLWGVEQNALVISLFPAKEINTIQKHFISTATRGKAAREYPTGFGNLAIKWFPCAKSQRIPMPDSECPLNFELGGKTRPSYNEYKIKQECS